MQRAGAFLEFLAEQIGFPKVQQEVFPCGVGARMGALSASSRTIVRSIESSLAS
jgi:hypothetical protein